MCSPGRSSSSARAERKRRNDADGASASKEDAAAMKKWRVMESAIAACLASLVALGPTPVCSFSSVFCLSHRATNRTGTGSACKASGISRVDGGRPLSCGAGNAPSRRTRFCFGHALQAQMELRANAAAGRRGVYQGHAARRVRFPLCASPRFFFFSRVHRPWRKQNIIHAV
jgi:hypothetical protein